MTKTGTGASVTIADAAITASLSDEGPAGSTFGLLQAQMKKLKKGKSVKLKAKVKKGKRKVKKHRKVLWESSDPTVARVSGSGKVKALKKGKAVIYAYAQDGKFAKCTVTVK